MPTPDEPPQQRWSRFAALARLRRRPARLGVLLALVSALLLALTVFAACACKGLRL
jgi:hypothetical protein